VTKLQILSEIKRTTDAHGGTPLSRLAFESETGIKRFDWFGRYWARWSDALREAGCEPHQATRYRARAMSYARPRTTAMPRTA